MFTTWLKSGKRIGSNFRMRREFQQANDLFFSRYLRLLITEAARARAGTAASLQ